jgi:hypothetical protein
MRRTLPWLYLLLLLSTSATAQKLSGQWTGGFISTGDFLGGGTEYVLELEVSGNTVKGHSYTYFVYPGQKRYYVICRLTGTYEAGSKSLVVTEVEKVKANTPPDFRDCLQTHMLTYMKKGQEESLEGKWKPAPGQSNCGVGETTLKRRVMAKMSPTSPTESISEKNSTAKAPRTPLGTAKPPVSASPKTGTTKPPATAKAKPAAPKTTAPSASKTPAAKPATPPAAKTTTKPPATTRSLGTPNVGGTKEKTTAKPKPTTPPVAKTPPKTIEKPVTVDKPSAKDGPAVKHTQINPRDVSRIDRRTKQVIKVIELPSEVCTVHLYDNGQVDGDTVSLYFNGKLMVASKRLSTTPITLQITLDGSKEDNDLVMYAENLGSIPPNTALMVVTVADKRYEVNITSTEQTSGTVRFRLKPSGP